MLAIVIQARVQSQRCKNKMLRNFANTDLISLALKKFSSISKYPLYFATYEPELITIGNNYNCKIIKRDQASAKSDKIEVVMNYLNQIAEPSIMFLNPCHPFLTIETVERAIQHYFATQAKSMTSVIKAKTWYYFEDGRPINFTDPTNLNTKATKPLIQVAHAFHIFDKERFIKNNYFWTHEEKDPIFFEIPEIEAIDIDTELDFKKAEALFIQENK